MLVKTKYFGEVELDEDKVLTFENGILGFEEYKKYAILYNNELEEEPMISWLQSLDEPSLALPIIHPIYVKADYSPVVSDEILETLGDWEDIEATIFLTMTVPADITQMTVNLKAPIIIHSETKKGCQAVAENSDYLIKYKIYEHLKELKESV